MTKRIGLFPDGKVNTGKMVKNKYLKYITGEQLMDYNLSCFKGEIVVVDNMASFREHFPRLLNSDYLGFDTETRPSFRKGRKNRVSLIQLAKNDLVCLFRINKIGIPEELLDLLANQDIIKAGVAIHDDIKILKHVRKFSSSGFIDLQKMVKEYGIQSSGLNKLAAIILGFRISKKQQVTNWEADQLTGAQVNYAATDAWICHQIYKKLTLDS